MSEQEQNQQMNNTNNQENTQQNEKQSQQQAQNIQNQQEYQDQYNNNQQEQEKIKKQLQEIEYLHSQLNDQDFQNYQNYMQNQQIQQQNQKQQQQNQENDQNDENQPMFLKDPEENRHFTEIIISFYNYQLDTLRDIAKMERDFNNMDQESKKYLNFNYQDRIERIKKANTNNYKLVWKLMEEYEDVLNDYLKKNNFPQMINVKPMNISKMRSTLKQLVRDWSLEGKVERDGCYQPVKDQINQYFKTPIDPETNQKRKVLFPGSGLGRIVFDMAHEGYATQGNEFSYHMLITANFILNNIEKAFQFEIQPHIHNFCNKYKSEDPFKTYKIPDICPGEVADPEQHEMSMVAGEFVEIYSIQKKEWDCIATCFFIDTAQNIVRYLMTIYNALKKGGIWVNFGPLQYHYSGTDDISIELSLEDVKIIAEKIGFKFIHESYHKNITYVGEHKQMANLTYDCVCLTAVKENDNLV